MRAAQILPSITPNKPGGGTEHSVHAGSILILPAMKRHFSPEPKSLEKAGVWIHGCHLQSDGWEEIMWGIPPDKPGRIPQGVLLAWEEQASLLGMGTGASKSKDGRFEGEFIADTLMERLDSLQDFTHLQHIQPDALKHFVKKVAFAETESQNTLQEIKAAFKGFASLGISRGYLVSSPTHLPRCLACALSVSENEREYTGEVYVSASATCYKNYNASDVVVVEPPHRGDRDKTLDDLPFHEMVKKSFKISGDKRQAFLQDFQKLLTEYGV